MLSRLACDRPAFLLHSAAFAPPFAARSILGQPSVIYRFTDRSEIAVVDAAAPPAVIEMMQQAADRFTHDPLADFQSLLDLTRGSTNESGGAPTGWIGVLSYELGAVIEPAAKFRRKDRTPTTWPLIEMGWCDRLHVHGAGWPSPTADADSETHAERDSHWHAGALEPTVPRETHISNVARTIEHIRAGDIFQANITQQFASPFAGNSRAFARTALEASGAWYGAMLELAAGTIVSMSPELFLHADAATRRVITRPIKGTLPRSAEPARLEQSEKDKAELAMIVDLMRNDLGRVCEIGTVRVPQPRVIETHGAVHQGVGEVTGTLRPDVSFSDLMRATFPPGSITGCPKIRATQIIDALEESPRGPYCGAIGVISDAGDITLNVAIRTAAIAGSRPSGRFDHITGTLTYGAGGGIVVDSDPASEYEETLAKTRMLQDLLAHGDR